MSDIKRQWPRYFKLIAVLPSAVFLLFACGGEPSQSANSASAQPSVDASMSASAPAKPNIVLIVTDDQGSGDIGVNQNPIIKTPSLDALSQQSVSFTNFHVDPTCSPTRAALLTGKHSLYAGVWHTILGRYMLGPEHQTLAEVLQENSYNTGIFGKWHLGDNYPYRPQDQGFNEVLIHGGGGVGQTPDFWGNTQFDDTYYHNGTPKKFEGYATKIWFDEAKDFITKHNEKSSASNTNEPYFAYIALNAPHGPYRAPQEYIQPYEDEGLGRNQASFYGMITYIDEQVGSLRSFLTDNGDIENTIFVFMTDNGSSMWITQDDTSINKGFADLQAAHPDWVANNGLRGYKGQVYEGGHKVPIYLSYPKAGLTGGELDQLTAHYDVMPTLLALADIEIEDELNEKLSGVSLAALIEPCDSDTCTKQKQTLVDTLENRSVVITNQRVDQPSPKRPTAVAFQDWRLISRNGKDELYYLGDDPTQQNNLVASRPDMLKQLKETKDAWWSEAQNRGFKDRFIGVGYPQENPVRLNAMDWMEVPEGQKVPWFIGHQPPAPERDYVHWITEESEYQPLPWYIEVAQAGQYKVSAYYHDVPAGTPVLKKHCVIDANTKQHLVKVHGRASHCQATIDLEAGEQKISAWFTDDKQGKAKEKAAFYLYIEKL